MGVTHHEVYGIAVTDQILQSQRDFYTQDGENVFMRAITTRNKVAFISVYAGYLIYSEQVKHTHKDQRNLVSTDGAVYKNHVDLTLGSPISMADHAGNPSVNLVHPGHKPTKIFSSAPPPDQLSLISTGKKRSQGPSPMATIVAAPHPPIMLTLPGKKHPRISDARTTKVHNLRGLVPLSETRRLLDTTHFESYPTELPRSRTRPKPGYYEESEDSDE